jgi:hypothetical protein
MKGGYQIIDFTGITEFDGTQKIPGAFEAVKKSGKPILAENVLGISVFTSDADESSRVRAVLPIPEIRGDTIQWTPVIISSTDAISTL